MSANRFAARWRRHHRIAQRFAALSMVGAYEMLGHTRSAAVAMTASTMGIGPRSIWTWLSWSGGEAPSFYTLECLGASAEDLK